jgi:membrane peptidoglycan carboxypeptidase
MTRAQDGWIGPPCDRLGLSLAQFNAVVGIGQYAVTVLDQANGMATFVAGGRRATAHLCSR